MHLFQFVFYILFCLYLYIIWFISFRINKDMYNNFIYCFDYCEYCYSVTMSVNLRFRVMVFNATFNNISVIVAVSFIVRKPEYRRKPPIVLKWLTHYPDSDPTSLCSFWILSGETTNTNFIVFGLTWYGVEPTIYRTRGEQANNYKKTSIKRKH